MGELDKDASVIVFTLLGSSLLCSHSLWEAPRDKKGWTQRVGLANVSPKGLYHVMRG